MATNPKDLLIALVESTSITSKYLMRAPPSPKGAIFMMSALPKVSSVREISFGAAGGPRGRCHLDLVCVVRLQLLPFFKSVCDLLLLLLVQTVIDTVFDPGIPRGAFPATYQVDLS